MENTIIKSCNSCKDYTTPAAKFQNEKYGGNRVFNLSQKAGKDKASPRCTVCGLRS